MHVDIIKSHAQLARVRENWEAVYAADPEAEFFLSWGWLRHWFGAVGDKWFVLAVKPSATDASYVGFFPLRWRTKMNDNGTVCREIAMAGNRLADYTGFICVPEMLAEVTIACARQLKAMSWTLLCLDSFCMSEARTSLLLASFPRRDYETTEHRMLSPLDSVDNGICPYVPLPDSFDRYLEERMGSSSRQKARRFLRKVDDGGDLRITVMTPETFDRDLAILVRFWKEKWAARKGNQTQPIINALSVMLRHCRDMNCLFMPVLWDGDAPLGTLAILVDAPKRSMLFQVSGLDTSRNNPAPGFLLHCYSIRHAIQHGYGRYDFLRGNEPYKYSFGSEERRIRHIEITCRAVKPVRPVVRKRADTPPWEVLRRPASEQPLPASLTGFPTARPDSPAALAFGRGPIRSS
jgi:CelD/BcsL family acetyltransferase involved in cellulose biosynthesis